MRLVLLVALVPLSLPAQTPPELLQTIKTAPDPTATQAAVTLQLRGAEALPLLPDLIDAWLAADPGDAPRLELPLLTLLPYSAEAAQRRLAEILEHRNDELEQVDRAVRLLEFLDRTAAPSPELRELLIRCTEQPEASLFESMQGVVQRGAPRCRVRAAGFLVAWDLSEAELRALVVQMLGDKSVASWALDTLASRPVDDPAVALLLVPLLRSPRHRDRAARLLTIMESLPAVLPMLIEVLHDEKLDPPTARVVLSLLAAMGTQARPAVTAVRRYLERSGSGGLQKRGAEVLEVIEGK